MKEIITKYVTAYTGGHKETMPARDDAGKNCAVRLIPLSQVTNDGVISKAFIDSRFLGMLTSDPSDASEGGIYYNSVDNRFYVYDSSTSTFVSIPSAVNVSTNEWRVAYKDESTQNANWANNDELIAKFVDGTLESGLVYTGD